jgi:hypothetical protein
MHELKMAKGNDFIVAVMIDKYRYAVKLLVDAFG